MATKKVDRIGPLFQRTDQGFTISKNANYTQADTSAENLTVYLYDESNFDTLTGGIDITTGSPTGAAEDTDIDLTLDTETGITLTGPTWYALYVVGDAGTVLIPNGVTANKVLILLHPNPS